MGYKIGMGYNYLRIMLKTITPESKSYDEQANVYKQTNQQVLLKVIKIIKKDISFSKRGATKSFGNKK